MESEQHPVSESGVGPHGGRSIDHSRDAVLMDAALEILGEVGYDRLTIDAVAARAHAGKASVYRRWPSKAELVVEALNSRKPDIATPCSGSLREDLHALMEPHMASSGEVDSALMMGLMSALTRDEELRTAFSERFVKPRCAALRAVLQAALERGEMTDGSDLEVLVDLVPSLMLHRALVAGIPPDEEYTRSIIERVIMPLACGPAAKTTRSTQGKKTDDKA
ncbi:MAG: TetR/AcrR family transcriptional regulator [Acidimicrobiales bacterium]